MAAAVASTSNGNGVPSQQQQQLPALDTLLRKSVIRTRGLFSMSDPLMLQESGLATGIGGVAERSVTISQYWTPV